MAERQVVLPPVRREERSVRSQAVYPRRLVSLSGGGAPEYGHSHRDSHRGYLNGWNHARLPIFSRPVVRCSDLIGARAGDDYCYLDFQP